MERKAIAYTDGYAATMRALTTHGLLLGSYDSRGRPNVMTIGWGTLGSVWGRPIWVVLVRPSRYSRAAIEAAGAFTVNVPSPDMAGVCEVCGTRSGRDADKFALCRITPERASSVNAPIVAECPVVYECRVVHTNEVHAPALAEDIRASAYRGGDFHRCFWGEVIAVRATADAAERLR